MKTEIVTPRLVQWFDSHFYCLTTKLTPKQLSKLTTHGIYMVPAKDPVLQKEDFLDVYLPSSTTYLEASPNDWLTRWRGDVGNREADRRLYEAGDRGRNIHDAIWAGLNNGIVVFNDPRKPSFDDIQLARLRVEAGNKPFRILTKQEEMFEVDKARRILDVLHPQILAIEETVFSLDNLECAGTLDLRLEIERGTYLIKGKDPVTLTTGLHIWDWKSSGQIDEDAEMQVSTYAEMVEEMYDREVVGCLIGHVNAKTKNGAVPGVSVTYLNRRQWKSRLVPFRAAQELWRLKIGPRKPVIFEFPNIITFNYTLKEQHEDRTKSVRDRTRKHPKETRDKGANRKGGRHHKTIHSKGRIRSAISKGDERTERNPDKKKRSGSVPKETDRSTKAKSRRDNRTVQTDASTSDPSGGNSK